MQKTYKEDFQLLSNFNATAKRSNFRTINMNTDRFFLGIFLFTFLASTDGTGSTGNSLVTCAACQTAQVKFDSWDCNVNCDVISSDNGT